jgi:BlaI family penicillinase repressor
MSVGASLLQNVAPYATLCSVTDGKTRKGMKMDESLPELGELEREVMQLVWANAPITAEAVREQLPRRLKESTVRTVLRRLEEKGYTTHTVDGRTFVYHAAEPRGKVAAKAVQRIVDWFCNGSIEEVLVGMVDTAMLDQRQLRKLADQVVKAKAKGGKK